MHKIRTIAIDMFPTSVSLSRGFIELRCANTAERIEVLLGMETLGDLRNIVLDGGPDSPHIFDAAFDKLLWPLEFACV